MDRCYQSHLGNWVIDCFAMNARDAQIHMKRNHNGKAVYIGRVTQSSENAYACITPKRQDEIKSNYQKLMEKYK